MALNAKYRIYLNETSIGTVQVTPLVDNIQFGYEKGDVERIRKTLDSDLILIGSDYQLIKTLESSGLCSQINLYIDIFCSGSWVRDFDGIIKIRKCKFDSRKCRVVLGVENNDVAKCVNDISGEKVNLYDVPFHPVVYSFNGTIEETTCAYTAFTNVPISTAAHITNTTCITPAHGWTVKINKIRSITAAGSFYNCECETTWVRQKVLGGTMPSGTGWISVGLDWVRAVPTTLDTLDSFGNYDAPLLGDIRESRDLIPLYNNGVQVTYDNGTFLSEALAHFINLSGCSYTLISDFFNINADNTHPVNNAYTQAAMYCQDLVIWKSADVKRPNATQNSFKMFISLDELLNEIKVLFNVEVSIYKVGATNYFRLEHTSYFDNTLGLDLTVRWSDVLKANEYTYKEDKLPREERFYSQSETDGQNGTFDGSPIMYDKMCSDAKTIVEYRAELAMTNMAAMFENESYSDSGLVFAATENTGGQNFVISTTELNDGLTWSKLQDNFYYYNRPFSTGTVNGVTKTFTLDKIKVEEVEVSNFCHCDFHAFNASALVKTLIGWAKIESAKYDAKNSKLILTLIH